MKRILSLAEFERAVDEEISVSRSYELPMCLIMILLSSGWTDDDLHAVLPVLRAGDLACRTGPIELALVLPNSGEEAAAPISDRVRELLPQSEVRCLLLQDEESAADLVERARAL